MPIIKIIHDFDSNTTISVSDSDKKFAGSVEEDAMTDFLDDDFFQNF